jgi:hypothetical protein
LDPVALEDVLQADPGLTSTGSSDRYINRGWQQVAVQPAAATGLWAVSSSASDTTQSIKVETVRTGGLSSSAAVTLNGTTRVQVAALTDHIEVTKFYSSAVGDDSDWLDLRTLPRDSVVSDACERHHLQRRLRAERA